MTKQETNHLTKTNVSFEEYFKRKSIELGNKVLRKKRIYLDLKYWIYCRDAKYNNPQKSIHEEIYKLLYQLVDSKILICPANWAVLSETFKQKDSSSRLRTAKIIDELSTNIVILPQPIIVGIELLHLLSMLSEGSNVIYPLETLVWTNTGCYLGLSIQYDTRLEKDIENSLQKDMFDTMTSLNFSSIISSLPFESYDKLPVLNETEFACKINKNTEEHKKNLIPSNKFLKWS